MTMQPLPDHDNHHNAAVCPYCTHNGMFVMVRVDENERLRDALNSLMSAVEAHKRYWPRVDWGSEQCERAIFAALDKAKAAIDG